MYIFNLSHLLDEHGDIPTDMPPQTKKMAGFLAMGVDATTTLQAKGYEDTGLRCHTRGCQRTIQ